jgi:hypothetical protein
LEEACRSVYSTLDTRIAKDLENSMLLHDPPRHQYGDSKRLQCAPIKGVEHGAAGGGPEVR